jgi:biotin synthase-related radical SAM superfamily protein
MNINRISKQTAMFAIGFLGIAGKSDYNQEVIYNMTETAYNVIVDSLGEGCSDTQIVKTYLNNKEYYDSLSW